MNGTEVSNLLGGEILELFVLVSDMGWCVDLNQSELTVLEGGEGRDWAGWNMWSRICGSFFFHVHTVHLDILKSFIYSPTDALVSSLKKL